MGSFFFRKKQIILQNNELTAKSLALLSTKKDNFSSVDIQIKLGVRHCNLITSVSEYA